MASSTIIPVVYTQQRSEKNLLASSNPSSSNRYSVQDHGHGYRTYSYEFDLYDYEPEQINVILDDYGTLRIRASRGPCREFRREYNLGGPNVETTLVRNTIDNQGHLRVEIDVRPRRSDLQRIQNNNILTFDLQGYRPEHITVRINRNGLLKVSGKHIDTAFENNINRQYYREYQLPSNIDPDQVRARIDENQILVIELPPPSSTSYYTNRDYWTPAYGRSYPPFYGTGPGGGYCCCNLM